VKYLSAPILPARKDESLTLQDIRIARAEKILARQRQVVASRGVHHPLNQTAASLLATMESVYQTMLRHRQLAEQLAPQIFIANQLLAAFRFEDFRKLAGDLEPIRLTTSQILVRPGSDIEHVIFIESGVASVRARSANRQIEVGTIGNDGLVGMPAILGIGRTPLEFVVQYSGDGLRMSSKKLRRFMDESPAVRDVILRYSQTLLTQTAQGAAALGLANIDQRVARWLLMHHDRLDADVVPLTHDGLANLLGVRRASVTEAIQRLEGEGAIRASRGTVSICDRQLLVQLSQNTYGIAEADYARAFPRAERSIRALPPQEKS
jgi:CRP-like cAMP-binding protein